VKIDQATWSIASDVVRSLKHATNQKQNGWLVDSSGNTHAVVPCVNHESALWSLFDVRFNPFNTAMGAYCLAIVDLEGCRCFTVRGEAFHNAIDAAMAGQPSPLSVHQSDGWYWIAFQADGLMQLGAHVVKFPCKSGPVAHVEESCVPANDQFVHLHVHSTYSLLDGVADTQEIAEAAHRLGQPAIALTDHGNMYGVYKFYHACNEVGVKPLLGCEFYLVDDVDSPCLDAEGQKRRFEYHQTVIAMNPEGWRNLCRLATIASRDHFYYVPRIDKKLLFQHNEGLIVLSGCFKGAVAWHLQQRDPVKTAQMPWLAYDPQKSRSTLQQYKDVFGDRYYAEVQAIDFQEYDAIVPDILSLAKEVGVLPVVTNDAHYVNEEDAILQSALSRVGKGGAADDVGGQWNETGCYFIKRRSQIQHPSFSEDMFSRTCEIADRVNLEDCLEFSGYMFPEYPIEQDVDWAAYQSSMTGDGQ